MSNRKKKELRPRSGNKLVVGVVARISGCASQKEVSLEDQIDAAKVEIADIYSDETDYRIISTKGKGEQLDRPELVEVELLIRSRQLDVLVMEDVGRLVRGTDAVRLWGIAVDHGVRCIAPNDCIDTIDESWEEDLISACRDHVGHNVHTSKRIKKKLMNRFRRYGAATPVPIAGYVKPDGAKTFHDWTVDEEARRVVLVAAELLRTELNCSLVADSLNSIGFPVGPYCRRTEWYGHMVRKYFANPILKGKPERGNMHSVKHHETGRRRSLKNPEGAIAIDVPHLQILPEALFDEINALLYERNSASRRKPTANGEDPLKGLPRKRTRFPGQHARCWYCGRIMVWWGNGIEGNLQCSGSRQWKCWNSVGVSGLRVCEHVVQKTSQMLYELEGFEDLFSQLVKTVTNQPRRATDLQEIAREEAELARQERNLMETIRKFGHSELIGNELEKLKNEKNLIGQKRASAELAKNQFSDFPLTIDGLRTKVENKFLKLATNSYEFGSMIPKIVPDVFVYLVRMCDGGPLLPRIHFTVDLSGAFTTSVDSKELQRMLRKSFTCDVFDLPKKEMIRAQAVSLASQNVKLKDIAAAMKTPTSTRVVSNAIALDNLMKSQNLSEPLQVQMEPPTDLKKLRHHKHERFSFEMTDGYTRPQITS